MSVSAKALLDSYIQVSSKAICTSCAASVGPSAHVCRWTAETRDDDGATLRERGECIAQVQDLFRFCNATTNTVYADALRSTPPQTVVLTTGPRDSPDHPLSISVCGDTFEQAPGSILLRRVHIGFYVQAFNVDDYLSLVPILFHECFAHAYCGVNVARAEDDIAVSFHDGWMDCIAMWVLEETLRVARASPALQSVVKHAGEFAS
jgi:hypothetical protein